MPYVSGYQAFALHAQYCGYVLWVKFTNTYSVGHFVLSVRCYFEYLQPAAMHFVILKKTSLAWIIIVLSYVAFGYIFNGFLAVVLILFLSTESTI